MLILARGTLPVFVVFVSHRNPRLAGVTLLELMTVLVVIAIVATMIFPIVTHMAQRMERSHCTMNLRSLYVGAELYLQDHHQWPQIDPSLESAGSNEYDREWIAALAPYKVSKDVWICPSVQKAMEQGTKAGDKLAERIDYSATPFDDKEVTPHLWSGQPWFVERNSIHGEGNLIIFTDGSIRALDEIVIQGKVQIK